MSDKSRQWSHSKAQTEIAKTCRQYNGNEADRDIRRYSVQDCQGRQDTPDSSQAQEEKRQFIARHSSEAHDIDYSTLVFYSSSRGTIGR